MKEEKHAPHYGHLRYAEWITVTVKDGYIVAALDTSGTPWSTNGHGKFDPPVSQQSKNRHWRATR